MSSGSSTAVSAQVDIDAPRAQVWEVLRDVERYPEWNPFTVDVRTDFRVGSRVRLRVALRPPLVVRQSMRITSYDEGRSFAWGTTMLTAAFLSTDRIQLLEDLPGGGTRYSTRDAFTGHGAAVVDAVAGRWVQRGFDDLVRALKERCEP